MKITQIKISNILGIAELEFSPTEFTVISGSNGEGKTSVLSAIQAAVGGGHDATLLRQGADKGEVVLVLDDGSEIRKSVTEKASNLKIIKDDKQIARPAEHLKALTDLLSVNPIDFLMASPKERARVLLETMPIRLDPRRIAQIVGSDINGDGDLAALDVLRKQIYDERTGINRAIKEKMATISQMQQALPEPIVLDSEDSEAELLAKRAGLEQARDTEIARVHGKIGLVHKEQFSKQADIKEQLQIQIDALKAEAQAKIDALSQSITDSEQKANAAITKAKDTFQSSVAGINEQLQVIKANAANIAKAQQLQVTVSAIADSLAQLKDSELVATLALAGIDEYKAELLASLPIAGLVVRDGDVFFNDVQFDRVNTAEQVRIAVEIAKLRAGELGIICVDRIECLDATSFAEFKSLAIESGLQMVVTRVSNGALAINEVAV